MEVKIKQLDKIFYDPKQGYSNVKQLFEQSKKHNLKLKYTDVKKWYDEQPVNQLSPSTST